MKGMNTSGPNGGKGATSGTKTTGTKVRVTGYQVRPRAMIGDAGKVSSGMDGNRSPKVPSQAAVNRGATTQMNAGTQKLGRTSPPPPAGPGIQRQPRSTQNTMTGKGSKQG